MLPDLISLALFVRAVDTKSLSKAAEQSHIALAAASRRIALLEHRYGVKLLYRSSTGVEPTPAGVSLAMHARRMMEQAEKLQAELSDYAKGVKGHIRIKANTSAITQYLPKDLAQFSANYPDVKLELEESRSGEIVQALREGKADISTGLANPASQNCGAKGGSLTIEKNAKGDQFGVCLFADNVQCEEWAMLRGDCRTGGIKATGFVTPAARYCAITGGTYATTSGSNAPNEQGTCTFKGGKSCDAGAYFAGSVRGSCPRTIHRETACRTPASGARRRNAASRPRMKRTRSSSTASSMSRLWNSSVTRSIRSTLTSGTVTTPV